MTEVEFDPHELIYRTKGDETGDIYGISVWPEGDEETTLLLRLGEPVEFDEEHFENAARRHLDGMGLPAGTDSEFEYDYGAAGPGHTGIWVPQTRDFGSVPLEGDDIGAVFAIGKPPLGATRGRPGREDTRWVYVPGKPGGAPSEPLKRLTAMHNELSRPSIGASSWGRINYPLRNDGTVFLRLTPGLPRAAVLVDLDPHAQVPCLLRVDLVLLMNWLSARVREGSSGG